jgi:hypothetical protein
MRFARLALLCLAPAAFSAESAPDFTGLWETTYGSLNLVQEVGGTVQGYYTMGGLCTVRGRTNPEGRLVFEYEEPSARGEGWFELSPDGNSFSGMWRAEGSSSWSSWEGFRSGSGSSTKWLVVLEAEWQSGLDEQEYSFGEMLEAWFSRVEGVEVRQRFIHDSSDLELFCAETAMLPGTVCLLVSSHASSEGVAVAEGTIGRQELLDALEPCRNLAMIHFSSCLMMAGDIPRTIASSRRDWPEGFVVSGYRNSVDWAASGILEILYLDLILEKGLTPLEACEAVTGSMDFAGARAGCCLEAAGFEWIAPRDGR